MSKFNKIGIKTKIKMYCNKKDNKIVSKSIPRVTPQVQTGKGSVSKTAKFNPNYEYIQGYASDPQLIDFLKRQLIF